MKSIFQRLAVLVLCSCLLILSVPMVRAAENGEVAQDISGKERLTDYTGFRDVTGLFNGNTTHAVTMQDHANLTLEYEDGIGSLYLIFDLEYGAYTVTDNGTGKTYTAGETMLLHEFLDLTQIFGAAPTSVTLQFDNGEVKLNELYLFTPGQVPDFVQQWKLPEDGNTDLVLFSTHGDDEQLFFAGVLPYYAVERDYQVQVVYLTNHRNNTTLRAHEMLNGLWAVGIRTYPVFGQFRDFFTDTGAKAYSTYAYLGTTEEELLGYVVENLRRFRPKVAVGHDLINGEYGHGMHILYADLLAKAVEISADASQYPELAEKYGVWDVPKTYLHLWPENPIYMDWDQPMESFDGMTPFEVTKHIGFACFESQQQDFAWYIAYPKTAAEVARFNPCEYGLYRTTVGPDVEKNDFFENVTTHAEDAELLAQQEEAERLAQEEAARQAEEEARQLKAQKEAEARAAEEQLQQERQQQTQQKAESRNKLLLVAGIAAVIAVLAIVAIVLLIVHFRRKK